VGRTPPEWFAATRLEYPRTLDLAWPEPAPGPWNNQKNVGQYIWDVINPNPARWKSGVRLLHHLLVLHKDDPEARTRVMTALGRLYFQLAPGLRPGRLLVAEGGRARGPGARGRRRRPPGGVLLAAGEP